MGELQLENIVNKLQQKFGVDVILSTPKVPFKETIKGRARTEAKHKKQSGGRGQYGHVFLEIEPCDEGDFSFEDKILAGLFPSSMFRPLRKASGNLWKKGGFWPVIPWWA